MGAWGLGNFENDDALDWVSLLEDDTVGDVPRTALHRIADADADEYLDAPDCCSALAAAEVFAAARGRSDPKLPPEGATWVERLGPKVTPGDFALALKAVGRVRDRSGLRELWSEGSECHKWLALIAVLESRLGAPGPLMNQISTTIKTWEALTNLGVSDGTELRLDFFYEPTAESAARALAAFLEENTDFEVRTASERKGLSKRWHVEGTTSPIAATERVVLDWIAWMDMVGHAHGPCEFDGWGAGIPKHLG